MKCELWKDILDYEGLYQVSNTGRVRSIDRETTQLGHKNIYTRIIRGQEIKQRKINSGYCIVRLCKDGVCKAVTVHRLVAIAFIGNKGSEFQVNHKDGNKNNNCVDNLEWCTQSENVKHSYAKLSHAKNTVKVKCVETGECFESIKQAAQHIGISRCAINAAVSGRNKTAGGYRWSIV